MSEFNFTYQEAQISIGTVDVAFDVSFTICKDESGEEVDWEVIGGIDVTGWDDEGEPINLSVKNDHPLFGEIVKYVDEDVVEQCKEDHSGW